ncbi:GDYXXLXY domain-containing protein [Halobacillus yeomjeoni]|uniref:GDYXXLXY domain-containing protein n=1 Tax=Halobacillus yeomjeoni TaxID=311194 RepID=A0A931MTT7_9BACI|nr:GDYXXLXY domain-containing protein [Halobacillus yeomjeoni]MBH0228750.1 GDYXXLXY domain-containing protein [Halobacillus yeomjeoni]
MKRKWFYVIVGFQILFLVGMSISYYAMDVFGESITLKTAPVDPRDPFYGDYVTLGFEVERFPKEKWSGSENVKWRERIFLLLEEGEKGIHQLVKASESSLQSGENQIVLPAKFEWYDEHTETYVVNLSVDRYYIEENTGEEYEGEGDRLVEIIVAPWGQLKIKSLKAID